MQENSDAAPDDAAPAPVPAAEARPGEGAPLDAAAEPGANATTVATTITSTLVATLPATPTDATPADATGGAPATSGPAAGSADTPVPAARAEPTLAETAAALAERFPALFTQGTPRPIKLRIQSDIQQRAPGVFTKKQLSIYLHRHTTGTAYLRALAASPQRFDLDGVAAGEVAAEHREAAVAELERRRQIVMERRAAERAARPPRAGSPGPARPAPSADSPVPAADGAPTDQPPRPPRPPRFDGPPRRERPARPPRAPHAADAPHAPHTSLAPHAAPARPRDERATRPPSRPAPSSHATARPVRDPRREAAPFRDDNAPLPEDPARRERALLLRAWEGSPLTPANFCALKGLKVAEFEAQIELARRERAERRG